MLTITFANLKPGTGKTTGAVWLAHAIAETGRGVLFADADPAEGTAQWSDLAGGFDELGIRVARMAWKDLDRRLGSFARADEFVVIDSPQIEDHQAIAYAAIRAADQIVVPVSPTPIELARSAPVREEIAKASAGTRAPRISVLLNGCITGANSTGDAREALTDLGTTCSATPYPPPGEGTRSPSAAQSRAAIPSSGSSPASCSHAPTWR
jgi:chromosome partitioning protein